MSSRRTRDDWRQWHRSSHRNGQAGTAGQPPRNGHDTLPNGHDTFTPLRGDGREPPEPLPYDPYCEQHVLGTLLADNRTYSRVAAFLRPTHFGNGLHRRIYEAIAAQIESGAVANPITIRHFLEGDPALIEAGKPARRYLVELVGAAMDDISAEDYARIVVELWRDREADIAYEDYRAARRHRTPGIGAGEYLARAHSRLDEILHDGPDLHPTSPTSWTGRPVPQREWIVPDWIPLRRATGLYGAPGAGKSLSMQMLATATALDPVKFPNASWLGLPVRQCRSVLFYCEDDEDEMHYRQEQINRRYGCTYNDLRDMLPVPLLGRDGTLMTFDRDGRGLVTPLFYGLRSIIKKHRAQLVILDTLSDVFGGNEINRSHARQFVQQVPARLGRDCNCGAVCCAHPSLTGINSKSGNSGSTGWPGAFRSHLYLHPLDVEPDGIADIDERILTRKKSNWARAGETIEMHWKDGVLIHKPQPTGILAAIGRRHAERVFLELLDERCQQQRWVSANEAARNYAPRVFGEYPKDKRDGFREKDFKQAMEWLLRGPKPLIVIEEYGRPSRLSARLVRALTPTRDTP
jgi:RecA-family ATPase